MGFSLSGSVEGLWIHLRYNLDASRKAAIGGEGVEIRILGMSAVKKKTLSQYFHNCHSSKQHGSTRVVTTRDNGQVRPGPTSSCGDDEIDGVVLQSVALKQKGG